MVPAPSRVGTLKMGNFPPRRSSTTDMLSRSTRLVSSPIRTAAVVRPGSGLVAADVKQLVEDEDTGAQSYRYVRTGTITTRWRLPTSASRRHATGRAITGCSARPATTRTRTGGTTSLIWTSEKGSKTLPSGGPREQNRSPEAV